MAADGEHVRDVVVVGASVAGLLAAAALARDGRTVTLLDRDDLPATPEARRGVPQGRQPHLLLHRGLRAIEGLLPGFADDLRGAGAVAVDTGHLAWLGSVGWSPRSRQLDVLLATRPLVEHLMRQRVRALPGVRVVAGARVEGLRRRDVGWWVDTAEQAWPADLVVDASGRSSRLPTWLDTLGVAPATVEEVDAHVGYSTVRVRLPADRVGAAGVVVLQQRGRGGGLALPAEGGWWTVTGIGAGEQRPPRDLAGLRDFLAALPDDSLARIAAAGPLDGDVVTHRQTGNLRHRYDRVRGWPDALVVVGDALCAFDPVYGQGITVAALEAHVLREADRRGRLTTPGGAARVVRTCLRLGAVPWQIATGEDRALAGLPASRAPMSVLAGRWIGELGKMSAHGDADAQVALGRVYHLVAPPLALFHPRLLARGLRARVRGYGPPVPRPVVLPDDVPGEVHEAGVVGGGR
ncbi:FAD-dependent oxidoreductase [Cellulomonas sp. S1-8]|uniref:FAD-dependent oxidoreductase n=1 Tax=Cellulomonas sp. S1-8 TaxID=2904790 RepID=UPI002243E9E2|nr:FAD-dependent oxidoreductase [Cellulomonas sp. S1-8]UZN03903.1 FAD-dependent oxidoreductase [Cellulomonas sp. S1-8]